MKVHRNYRHCLQSVIVASAILLTSVPAVGGNHWLSKSIGPDSQAASSSSNLSIPYGIRAALLSSNTTTFDITISLEGNPLGDDDAKQDPGTSDDPQNAYENRIKEFANAVFQATNGSHKIGKVTIYRNGDLNTKVDVQWEEDCDANNGPWAYPSGFGVAGSMIHMCTNWTGSSSMSTPKGSGYTMAHEWGHYTFGLYDEYAQDQCDKPADACIKSVPLGTDTAAIASIMNNQWYAASGTVPTGYSGKSDDFLEYSTQNIAPYDKSGGTNAHFRVYAESTWETLTRSTKNDPKLSWLPQRTQYTALTAPTTPNFIVKGALTEAQSKLDIQWVGTQTVELMIDRSGSMGGTPITNARTAANLLIGQLPEGKSAIGVGSFSTTTVQNYTITDIPKPDTSVKTSAQAAVSAINATGGTHLYDGLIYALSQLQASGKVGGVVYVLGDGDDYGSSSSESAVIAAYQAANVPIIAFAYGNGAPGGTLSAMATATKGAFFQSPTSLAEIQAAFVKANTAFSSNVLLASQSQSVVPGIVSTETLPVDSTLGVVTINVSYTGSLSDLSFRILNPANQNTGVAFDCNQSGSSISCTATLDTATHGVGNYVLEKTSTASLDVEVSTLISASPSGTTPYDVAVDTTTVLATYPQKLGVRATIKRDAPITGLTVTAVITDPSGIKSNVILLDDGANADGSAADGTYGRVIEYKSDGDYDIVVTASNAAGTAKTAYVAALTALKEDGTAFNPVSTAVTENFVRLGTTSFAIAGFQSDDHNDSPTGSCTTILADNSDTPGIIDSAGDADCFSVTPTSLINDLAFRVTGLSNGMEPALTIFDADGSTMVAEVNLTTSENDGSGVIHTIAASNLKLAGYVLLVKHTNALADKGGYEVSVGEGITSDVPVKAVVIPSSGGGGGGAINLWSLVLLLTLAVGRVFLTRKTTPVI